MAVATRRLTRRGEPGAPSRPTLFYIPISHYCVSVERMLAYKGIPAEIVYVPYHDKTELIKATGQDYAPALVWDGEVIKWREIPAYLERKKPEPRLYPGEWAGIAQVLENWGHQILEERIWRAVVTKVPPTLQSDEERWVFEEMQSRSRGPWHILELREGEYREEMVAYLQLVQTMLSQREWILGAPSVADFGIYGGISPLLTVGEELPSGLPDLADWVARIRKLRADGSGTRTR
jgi:glutathione S-transferase